MLKPASYRPDIDGLRALAVLAVMGFHAFPDWVDGGFIGVDIFFVISGYLISGIILGNLMRGTFSFIGFYGRRIRRIFPALLLLLATCLVAGWFLLLPFEYKLFGKQIAAASAYVSNLLLWSESGYFDLDSEVKPLLHLWSLGVEEQFYLLWPLFLFIAWKKKWNLLVAIGAVASLSFATDLVVVDRNAVAAFFSPMARFWELAAGALLSWMEEQSVDLFSGRKSLASSLGTLILAAGFYFIDRATPFPNWMALLPCLGTCLLISAGPLAWINRQILSLRPLVWVGLISYPLYLWHWPLLSFARILNSATPSIVTRAALLVIAMPLAAATYFLVERPVRFGPNGGRKAIVLFGALLLAGALGAGVYLAQGIPSRPPVIGQKRPVIKHDEIPHEEAPCSAHDGLTPALAKVCVAHVNPGAAKRVVLWGDSHIGVWRHVVERIAHTQGVELYVIGHEGCPPLDGVRRSDTKDSLAICGTLDVLDHIEEGVVELKPHLVILTARWSLYAHGWVRNGRLLKANSFLTMDPTGMATRETSRQALARRIPVAVRHLQEHNIGVLLFKSAPILKGEVTNVRKSIAELQVTEAEDTAFETFTDDILGKLKDVPVFDPSPALCHGVCEVERNGRPLYYDDNHLSAYAADTYEQEIGGLIRARLNP